MKRRQLLKSAGVTLALTGFGFAGRIATAAAGEDFRWSRASADALVGQSFWLNHPEMGAVALTLARLRVPATKKPDPRLDQFTLLFHAPLGAAIADGTYDLEHPAIGHFALHLAPAGADSGAALYRSDFTLLVSPLV